MIEIKKLNKFFNKGRQNEIHVINDVDLELPSSGMVSVFGKSGCGKTTLLNVIGGLDGFASGSISIDGRSIRRNTDEVRNEYVGYIFQNYNLHKSETCFENVADALRLCGMNDKKLIEERVMAALSNVGMDKYRNRTPDTLSGGQQQRIAIARAIVKNPRIILADEPTGNLDEANTVMIMDLLRQIAKDHLVLLVTHEANLVDYYCDKVIELSDGKIVNIRNNNAVGGYSARDKNAVYLGELEKTEIGGDGAVVEYYGDAPNEPVKLKIVNDGGKLYIRIDTPKVQVIDEFSEVRLREGVYEEKAESKASDANIDMSKLPTFKGSRFGRLFTLASSVRSGYKANFSKGKRGKKLLRGCMCMFAAVIVLMSSLFGTSFRDLRDAKGAYNHNVFYVYTPDPETSAILANAVGNSESAIDYIRLDYNFIPTGDNSIKFGIDFFETFTTSYFDESFLTNAVYLGASLAEDLPVVAGNKKDLGSEEILITTAVADSLIAKSSVGFIADYDDLIGLATSSFSHNGKNLRVAGVVESSETTVYVNEVTLANSVIKNSGLNVSLGKDVGYDVEDGKVTLILRHRKEGDEYPEVGDKVFLNGVELELAEILRHYSDYDSYLEGNSIKKMDEEEFFRDLLYKEFGITEDSHKHDFWNRYNEIRDERYYEYYDYKYSEIDAFLEDYYRFDQSNFEAWLYVEKDIELAKYFFMPDEYYKAIAYKEMSGRYPAQSEMWGSDSKENVPLYEKLPDVYKELEDIRMRYSDEFYSSVGNFANYGESMYLLSEKDYIAISKRLGETDPTASGNMMTMKETIIVDGIASSGAYYSGAMVYTVIHSSDPERTARFIEDNFSDLDTGDEFYPAILSPDDIFENLIKNKKSEIIGDFVTMGIILIVMSLCMYFIMRSSLLSRIKEVGIYRAIGVSKKNLMFRFFVESIVLTTLTVFIGYLLTSAFISLALGLSSLVSSIFYYPVWLALAVFAALYAVCTLCGIAPIMSLLKRTPSEIIAKYDI